MIPRHLLITVSIVIAGVLAMGFYGLHLKHRAEELEQTANTGKPVAPPVSGNADTVSIQVADDGDGTINRQTVRAVLPSAPDQRAKEILRLLFAAYQRKRATHHLSSAADVRAVFLIGDGTAVIDTSPEFADQHESGVLVEQLTLASIAQSLAANFPNLKQVKILVDGKERETLAGHVDLSNFYPVSTDMPRQ